MYLYLNLRKNVFVFVFVFVFDKTYSTPALKEKLPSYTSVELTRRHLQYQDEEHQLPHQTPHCTDHWPAHDSGHWGDTQSPSLNPQAP